MGKVLVGIGALAVALVASFAAGDVLQARLDRWIRAGEEFAIVRVLVGAWAIVAAAMFGIVLPLARTPVAVKRTAIALVAVVIAAVVVIFVLEMIIDTKSLTIPREDLVLVGAIAAPLLLVVAIQWAILRLYWRLWRTSAT